VFRACLISVWGFEGGEGKFWAVSVKGWSSWGRGNHIRKEKEIQLKREKRVSTSEGIGGVTTSWGASDEEKRLNS